MDWFVVVIKDYRTENQNIKAKGFADHSLYDCEALFTAIWKG